MVSRIKTVTDIKWDRKELPLTENNINLAVKIPFNLPQLFIDLLKISDGGSINYEFDYHNIMLNDTVGSGIGGIFGLATENSYISNTNYDPFADERSSDSKEFFISYNNIIDNYYDPPEFFPKNLVAFAETGGGDLVCFDYRTDQTTNNPPIVYWFHEGSVGEDVSFLANNFEEFIQVLREPEPFEEFLKKISKKEE